MSNYNITFNVILGLAGRANLASVWVVEFDLTDVGAETVAQGVVSDARQLDVVDVAVAVGTDVSRRLMRAERMYVKMRLNTKIFLYLDNYLFVQWQEDLDTFVLVLPEVKGSQTEVGSSVRNLYHPVHNHDLTLLHCTRQACLPANHKLT